MSDVTTIPVGDDYDVLVGHGVSTRVAEVLPEGVTDSRGRTDMDAAAVATLIGDTARANLCG